MVLGELPRMVGGGPQEVGMRSHRMSSEAILGRSLRSILRMVPECYTTKLLNYYTLLPMLLH